MSCSGCGNRHDEHRCPHGGHVDQPSDWVRQAIAQAWAEQQYWEEDSNE